MMTKLRNLFSYHVHEPHSKNNEYKNMCVMHIIMCFLFRLAKAEDNHQIAIAEKLDLEARLNEEKQISKVFKLACLLHAHVQTSKFFVLFCRDMMII